MFQITIETNNAAFCDEHGHSNVEPMRVEIARILREIARRIDQYGDFDGIIRDVNGNRVGNYSHS